MSGIQQPDWHVIGDGDLSEAAIEALARLLLSVEDDETDGKKSPAINRLAGRAGQKMEAHNGTD